LPGYKKPCKYCGELLPPNSNLCPLCNKVNPLDSLRCPKCRAPVQPNWKACNSCGLLLEVKCPKCDKLTFFGDYCQHCDARLLIECPNCHTEQAPVGETCIKCHRPLGYPVPKALK